MRAERAILLSQKARQFARRAQIPHFAESARSG